MEISERIKSLREKKRYSQYDLADKLGISQSAYLQIEKGKTELSVARLMQLAETLDVSPVDLLGIDFNKESEEDQLRIKQLEDQLESTNRLLEISRLSERKYADFVGVLFHRIDWAMLVVAFDHHIITDKELGSYLHRNEYEGKKTVIIKLERVDNFPNYDSYTSQFMTQTQIFETLPFLSEEYSHDYQTLIKLYQSGLLPEDGLKKALDNRFTDEYWAAQATS